MKCFSQIENIREIRKNLGMNQQEFWNRLGVTQSGGSRYESGRNMPKPVRELFRLVHIEHLDLAKINKTDIDIAKQLKKQHPDIYSQLRKKIKASQAEKA